MKTWTFHKLVRLEELLEQDIFSISRITGAWEIDSGFELELEAKYKDGKTRDVASATTRQRIRH